MNAVAAQMEADCDLPRVVRRDGRSPMPFKKAGRLALLHGSCAAVLVAVCGWTAYWHSPTRCYGRAITAFDAADGQRFALEQINYELLWLQASLAFDPHASLLRGKLLLAQQRCDAALDELRVADSNEETRVRAMLLAGEGLFKTGRFRQAGIAWTRALELDPANIDAHRWLGVAYYELGTVDAAIYYLNKVATLDPADPRPHRVIGVIWRDLDEYHHAAEAFRESLARDSTSRLSDLVRLDLGQVLNNTHGHAEALKILAPLAPTVEAQTMRSACWYGLGEMDRAAAALDEVLERAPELFPALMTRAKIALEQSNPVLAADLAQRAAKIKPKSPETLQLLISTYTRQGQREKAKECVDRLKEVTDQLDIYHSIVSKASNDPLEVELRYRAGVMAADLGMEEAAKWWLKAALLLEPENLAVRDALSRLNKNGDSLRSPAEGLSGAAHQSGQTE